MGTDVTATNGRQGKRPRILIADDERSMRELLAIVLRREGYEVDLADCGRAAVEKVGAGAFDLLISDIKLPDMSGVEVLRAAKQADPDLTAIMITAYASTETAVEAMRLGACDYLSKPFEVDALRLKVREKLESRALRSENLLLKRALGASHEFSNMIGRSPAMLEVFRTIQAVSATDSTILVTGESGTGKELVARAIHHNSLRRGRPFVAINCAAIPENLLESELFGHVRGAFTGAETSKKGLIEMADRGTVFLDEIADMTPALQVKILRVIQERRFRRVGALEETAADIRLIAATNRDLTKLVAEGRFREDLYYRINVIPIHLPPLRERREDIPLLAGRFLERYRDKMGKNVAAISAEAMAYLVDYEWPGNVRELENVIERAVALEPSRAILPETLPAFVRNQAAERAGLTGDLPESGFDLEEHVNTIEKHYIREALRRAGGVQVKAAELLGMKFRSFRYYAKKYNLT
ncbi:MAG: sigma-54-dependent transcriptional regulator [Vicinamibacterales bacterium]